MPSLFATRNAPRLESAARLKARREAIRHRRELLCKRGARDTGYRPAWIRREILTLLTAQWITSNEIHHHFQKMDPHAYSAWRINAVLDFLTDHFRIEQGKVYHWRHDPKHPRTTLESRMEEPPLGTVIGHGFTYRLMPYPLEKILTLIDRLADRQKAEEHPRPLAAEFSFREDFVWQLWSDTRDPEWIPHIRHRIRSRISSTAHRSLITSH